ncbi:MAG: class I SAM-dependent methyltransferase [Myxococcales bacterium]|nr:class I SAM-dependent methyltransferase [Myxococcales bacterium]
MNTGPRDRRREQRALLAHGTSDHYVDPELYDFEYHERLGDVMWYRGLTRRTGPVSGGPRSILELGAGTGRITIPLLTDGHAVTALDRMRTMLDALERKLALESRQDARARLRLVLADMRALPLPDSSFELVIAPFNTLQHLYTADELLRCFREVARVLVPGGTFAFDVMLPDLDWLTWDPTRRHAVTPFVHPRTRARLIYSTNHHYDAHTQVCHIRIYYDDDTPTARARLEHGDAPEPEPRELVHLAHRQIFPEELRALLPAAGLTLDRLEGDFRGLRLGEEIESMVAVSHKPR